MNQHHFKSKIADESKKKKKIFTMNQHHFKPKIADESKKKEKKISETGVAIYQQINSHN